jgi:hypothetical protein
VAEAVAAVLAQMPFPAAKRRKLWVLGAKLQDQCRDLRAAADDCRGAHDWFSLYKQACAARAVCWATERDLARGKDPPRAAAEATYEAIAVADDPAELFGRVLAAADGRGLARD